MTALPNNDQQSDPLLQALGKIGDGSVFLWKIFIVAIIPTIFSGMHAISYVFTAEIPNHWCEVKELTLANWSKEKVKTVSSASSCTFYNYNYTYFVEIGYEEAFKYSRGREFPKPLKCTNYLFGNDLDRKSMVEEWGLVCENSHQRATVQMALSLGKTIGAISFGTLSDKFGRRKAFVIGIILSSLSGPLSAFVPWYWTFIFLRLVIGSSHTAILSATYTILTEVAGNKHRQWMGTAYNCGYPIGTIILTGIAYLSYDWRQIQLACSLLPLIMILFIWILPESPRWLISKGRREEARNIIEKPYGEIIQDNARISIVTVESTVMNSMNQKSEEKAKKKFNSFYGNFQSLKLLCSHRELRKRAIIMSFCWLVASMAYYALALNGSNFSVNSYLYTFLMGLTEIPSYLLPILLLMVMGRRTSTALLYFMSSFALLSILVIPESKNNIIMVAGLVGKFAISAVFGVIVLYNCELFPTVTRNTAFGSSSGMSHFGSISAPLIVDILGAKAWWAPSTFCACFVLFAGILSLTLPETRDRELTNTVEEELEESKKFQKPLCC